MMRSRNISGGYESLWLCIIVSILGLDVGYAQHYFKINDFAAHSDDLKLLGASDFMHSRLRLTQDGQENSAGACWYPMNQSVLENGFSTEFTFQLSSNTSNTSNGDGFAFVLHGDHKNAIGGYGNKLGYMGIKNAVVIEFDTYDNDEGSKNHICVAYYNTKSEGFKRLATVHSIAEINDGQEHYAMVEYKDGYLTFFLDDYIFPIVSTRIDLSDILRLETDGVWMGFTASTSEATANHDLLRWSFQEFSPKPDIEVENIEIVGTHEKIVNSRQIKLSLWDHNKVDGDIISIKAGDKWLISNYKLKKKPHVINFTFTGFNTNLTVYANNIGSEPPNTVSVLIDDGYQTQEMKLEADLLTSESILLKYSANNRP